MEQGSQPAILVQRIALEGLADETIFPRLDESLSAVVFVAVEVGAFALAQ
jgi:hypothetical protein